MKWKSKLLVSAAVVSAAFAGLAACGGDDSAAPATTNTDAGPGVDGNKVTDSGTTTNNDTGTTTPPDDADTGDTGTTPPTVAKRASKSGTIAISDDDAIVGMVNPEASSVSFFKTSDNTRVSVVATGNAPSSIVIASDSKTAYVANRADATVVKISGIDTATPTVGTPVPVGAEPTGIALSPLGTKLFVAEFAEGTVGIIDTAAMTRTPITTAVRNPRAIAVTNNLDTNETDETVVVTEFYGEPVAGKEAENDGRVGHVRLFGFDGSAKGSIDLAPFSNTEATFESSTQPNQLHAVAINGAQIFVPSISSSPALPLQFDKNIYSVMYVGDLASKTEVTAGAGTANLSALVKANTTAGKFFLADTVDVDFVPGTKIAYAVARGADVVERIDYSGASVSIGAAAAFQIDVQGSPLATDVTACHTPTGIAIAAGLQKGYVNCWGTHRMAVIDFTSQAVTATEESTPPATSSIEKGRHFFFTGRGRWSGNGTATTAPTANGSAWSSCGSCHPDAFSDNVTWIFGSGPRQTVSLDGMFSHGATGAGRQRMLNWTAVNDEVHDFENNVRGTSGGLGSITNAGQASDCGNLANETRRNATGTFPAGMATISNKDMADGLAGDTPIGGVQCKKTDYDDINNFLKQLTPPKGPRFADAAAIGRGATLFGTTGRCDKCHAGPGFTVSRRAYTPSGNGVATFAPLAFPGGSVTIPTEFLNAKITSANTTQIQTQAAPAAAVSPDNVAQTPAQGSCVIRNVGTFGARNADGSLDATTSLSLEVKVGAARAEGFAGYNVPSLYGMTLGAPYLHHGQAATLEALFTDTKYKTHWTSGNPNFDPTTGTNAADLAAYLRSIDGSTTEVTLPTGFDVCPP